MSSLTPKDNTHVTARSGLHVLTPVCWSPAALIQSQQPLHCLGTCSQLLHTKTPNKLSQGSSFDHMSWAGECRVNLTMQTKSGSSVWSSSCTSRGSYCSMSWLHCRKENTLRPIYTPIQLNHFLQEWSCQIESVSRIQTVNLRLLDVRLHNVEDKINKFCNVSGLHNLALKTF